MDTTPERLDPRFWDGSRWNGHAAFDTVAHIHVSCYDPAEGFDSCDIMAVERADGSWHVEDNWGGDAQGAEGVWNPFDPSDAPPQIYPSQDAAIRRAVAVVAAVSGVDPAKLLEAYLDDGSEP